jgi:hypothetical protein
MITTIENICEEFTYEEYNEDTINRLYKKISDFLEDNNIRTNLSKSDIKKLNDKIIVDFNFTLN